VFGSRIALIGGLAIPGNRRRGVSWNTLTGAVHARKRVLGAGITLIRGLLEPPHRLASVARRTLALRVHQTKLKVRAGFARDGEHHPQRRKIRGQAGLGHGGIPFHISVDRRRGATDRSIRQFLQ